MAKKLSLAVLGDPTTTGGEIVEGAFTVFCDNKPVALVGGKATCPNCKKGWGKICRTSNHHIKVENQYAALGDFIIDCGCPVGSNRIITPKGRFSFIGLDDGMVQVSLTQDQSLSLGDGTPLTADKMMSSMTESFAAPSANVPSINPNNMYWPPYNFLGKEGEKEIHVRYTQDTVEVTVLSPDEWREFFDMLDKTQNIGGAISGTYDAFDTAKKLGGLGVTAYVKTHNGVDYIILKGYKQHMKTLLAGNRFKASNPQVVKLGLGALDSVKGMARYVKITAPVEVLVGSAINVLQFVLNDEYMFKELGLDQAKLLVNALAVAGAGLFFASLVPAFAATAVGAGLILVGASFSVWVVDKFTDFEKKTVNKVLELLDD